MKRTSALYIVRFAAFAILPCLASRSNAISTHALAHGTGSQFTGLHVDYTVAVENSGS